MTRYLSVHKGGTSSSDSSKLVWFFLHKLEHNQSTGIIRAVFR